MQAFYGNYAFPPNSVIPQTRKRLVRGANGLPASTEVAVECSGEIIAAGQRATVAACAALERALAVPFRDFVIRCDDGSVAVSLPNATALGGVLVTEGPDYPKGDGAEFATGRAFRFVVSATYPLQAGQLILLTYEETVTFRGGGPQVVFMEPVNGPSIPQLAKEATAFYATQAGTATGLLAYPTPPRPLWPGALLGGTEAPVVARTTPAVQTGLRQQFRVTWQYNFGSVVSLNDRGPTII